MIQESNSRGLNYFYRTKNLCFRLLTLWFDFGHWPDVNEALVEGIKTIQIDNWLQVSPNAITAKETLRKGFIFNKGGSNNRQLEEK